MKIMIIGYPGSGKSTLAKKLSSLYECQYLHMDKISFYPNWVEKENDLRINSLKQFLNDNPSSWVIDGNYFKILFEERVELANQIIFLNFNRFTCYFSALKRALDYRNKTRESAPEGCKEKFSLSFQWWILHQSRTKKRKIVYSELKNQYSEKFIELKNRKEVRKYLEKLKDEK